MSAFKKPLLIIGLGLVAWFGLQWKVNKDTKEAFESLKPYVNVDFKKARLKLSGELSVQDLTIYSGMIGALSADEISWNYGNFIDTVFAEYTLNSDEIPESISLKVNGLRLPLLDLSNNLPMPAKRHPGDLIAAAACGARKQIYFNEFMEMGYDEFVISLNILLETGLTDTEASLQIAGELEDIMSTEIAMLLDKRLLGRVDGADNPFEFFKSIKIAMIDLGYNQNKAEFCARESGNSVADYQKSHISEVLELFGSAGLTPSSEFTEAYEKSIRPGSKLEFSLRPQPGVQPSDFQFYDAAAIQAMLGVKVFVDDKQISTFFENWDIAKFARLGNPPGPEVNSNQDLNAQAQDIIDLEPRKPIAPQSRKVVPAEVVQPRRSKSRKQEYRPTPVSEASNYIDSEVTIIRTNGKSYIGTLKKVQGQKLWVSVSQSGGRAVIPVSVSKIAEFQVADK